MTSTFLNPLSGPSFLLLSMASRARTPPPASLLLIVWSSQFCASCAPALKPWGGKRPAARMSRPRRPPKRKMWCAKAPQSALTEPGSLFSRDVNWRSIFARKGRRAPAGSGASSMRLLSASAKQGHFQALAKHDARESCKPNCDSVLQSGRRAGDLGLDGGLCTKGHRSKGRFEALSLHLS